MKQQIILLLLAFCLSIPAAAQYRHEFSATAGGGLSSLQYSYDGINQTPGFGGKIGLGYHYFFSPQWAIGTGIDLALYNAKSTAADFSGTSTATSSGGPFYLNYAYANYEEKVSATLLTIPLMAHYQSKGTTTFYGSLGGKIGIPISSGYTSSGDLSTTGYFPNSATPIISNMPDKGFGIYPGINQDNDMDLNVAFMLSAEAGIKWSLCEQWNLYTGLYCDYGLNNINKEKTTIIGYQPTATSYPNGFVYGSIAEMSSSINLLTIGVTVRLSFGHGCKF